MECAAGCEKIRGDHRLCAGTELQNLFQNLQPIPFLQTFIPFYTCRTVPLITKLANCPLHYPWPKISMVPEISEKQTIYPKKSQTPNTTQAFKIQIPASSLNYKIKTRTESIKRLFFYYLSFSEKCVIVKFQTYSVTISRCSK